jgi:hypothetical protein
MFEGSEEVLLFIKALPGSAALEMWINRQQRLGFLQFLFQTNRFP